MNFLILLPILITLFGILLIIKLRFFFITHPISVCKRILCLMKNKETRKTLSLALAGTLGVGNIVGVAYGISVGGTGCVFWIFVSGIFAAVIKYAESSLASDFIHDGRGGMMYVILKSFGNAGKKFALLYSTSCLFLSLSMGAALQSQSVVRLSSNLNTPEILTSLVFTLLVFLVVVGGVKKVESATAKIIPMATIIYIIMCISVILLNASRLPSVIANIMANAFNFKSAVGGVSTYSAFLAIKEGYLRGLLSNEAGAGTSSMAESRADIPPSDTGLLGVLEVLFDTMLLCTLTALSVLLVSENPIGDGMKIVSDTFKASLGNFSVPLLFFLIFAFAYSTVVCWYYYGTVSLEFILGKKKTAKFTAVFLIFVFVGFLIPQSLLITLSDSFLFVMSIISLFAVLKNSERIVRLSENCGLLKARKSKKSDV